METICMKTLSKKATAIQPSATMAIDAKVRLLRTEGVEVFAFGGGEPDFIASPAVLMAGVQAIATGQTKYTPATGTMALRQAVANRLQADYGLTYDPGQIVVTSGGKHAIYAALQVLIDPGDEVILPAPYWVSYYAQIQMAGGVPVVVHVPESQGFKITPRQLAEAVTERTKLFLLNNPGNPTGAVYTAQELEGLARVCQEKDLYVLADEMYAKLCYGGRKFVSFPSLSSDAFSRTVLINGASKAYAMTGWRIGYAAAPEPIAKTMAAYLSQSTGCPASMSQAAATEAFSGSQDYVETMRQSYEERRNYLVKRIQAMEGLACTMPDGAFYLLIQVDKLYGRTLGGVTIQNDVDFATALLDTARVAVTPGSAFEAPGYVRWCYAASLEQLKGGLDRLEAFLQG
jgi:aspartate aminotransferase